MCCWFVTRGALCSHGNIEIGVLVSPIVTNPTIYAPIWFLTIVQPSNLKEDILTDFGKTIIICQTIPLPALGRHIYIFICKSPSVLTCAHCLFQISTWKWALLSGIYLFIFLLALYFHLCCDLKMFIFVPIFAIF